MIVTTEEGHTSCSKCGSRVTRDPFAEEVHEAFHKMIDVLASKASQNSYNVSNHINYYEERVLDMEREYGRD